jgi:pyruvate formate lyase activating enzyme
MADTELHAARYWRSLDDETVECILCPWHCRIKPDAVGRCDVRENRNGRLYTINYGQITSIALDPIEKKPLYHFHPGTEILSVGSFGCNLSCRFCQNWQIAHGRPPTRYMSPQELADLAVEYASRGSIGVAYTYNEPIVSCEYILDSAPLVAAAGLKNIMVTNGIIEPEPLDALLPFIDAMNVDIKSMDDDFYKRICGGRAQPPRATVEHAITECHIEITNLLIPGENDADDQIEALVNWAASVSPDLPLHLSAYHPAHEFTAPPTPDETLKRAFDIATRKLHFVYVGNARVAGTTDTRCPNCGAVAVKRNGYTTQLESISEGRCSACGAALNIIQ